MYIELLIPAILSVFFLALGILFLRKEHKLKHNCTAMIKGKVIKYNFREPPTPVVQYAVNGATYKKSLFYSVVITKSNSKKPVVSQFDDANDTVLRINENSLASYTSLRDMFPIGSEMNVYYDPNDPKRSYVLRYAKSPLAFLFLMMGILFLLMAPAIFLLLYVNQIIGVVLLSALMFIVFPASTVCILLKGARKKS